MRRREFITLVGAARLHGPLLRMRSSLMPVIGFLHKRTTRGPEKYPGSVPHVVAVSKPVRTTVLSNAFAGAIWLRGQGFGSESKKVPRNNRVDSQNPLPGGLCRLNGSQFAPLSTPLRS